jgi:hypothetical protein
LVQPTSSKADFAFSGVGAISCGTLSQDYRQNPTQTENMMMTWAQGFMSGENIALPPGHYRDLQAMTLEAQESFLRNYCDEHPMAEFIKAAIELYLKLPMKKLNPPASTSQ